MCYAGADGVLTIVSSTKQGIHLSADASNMFAGFTALAETPDFSKIWSEDTTDMSGMFKDCTSLTEIDLTWLDTSSVTNLQSIFQGDTALQSVNMVGMDLASVTDFSYMFYGLSALEDVNLTGINAANAESMRAMFYGCTSLQSADLSAFTGTKLNNLRSLFSGCTALRFVNLNGVSTAGVTDMSSMFYNCSSLKNIDVSGLNTSSLQNMSYMFAGTGASSLDLSSFDTSKVTSMTGSFMNSAELQKVNIRGFDTSKVTGTDFMFYQCPKLETILCASNFNTSALTSCVNMFYGCTALKGMNGTAYTEAHSGKDYARLDAAGAPGYFTDSESGRYAVSFNQNGYGTQIPTQMVAAGGTAVRPADPTASGVVFDNWYTSSDYSELFSFDSLITVNRQLFAKWYLSGSGTSRGYAAVAVGIGGSTKGSEDDRRNATADSVVHSNTLSTAKGENGHWFWRVADSNYHFVRSDGTECTNGWHLIADGIETHWYYFNANGAAVYGWFKNEAGDWYYIKRKTSDNPGGMVTGWQWLPCADGVTRCFYFEESPTLTMGAMYKSGTTRDGYVLDDTGAWVVNGVVQTR